MCKGEPTRQVSLGGDSTSSSASHSCSWRHWSCCETAQPPLQLFGEPTKNLCSARSSVPTSYTDDLYGFTIKYPQLAITSLVAFNNDPTCKGVMFAPETEEHQPDPLRRTRGSGIAP